ncbi:hypothetical protein F511_36457 [Dorcoceras hygrometricum]|uniref:Uncharacterized protein n=1 Tax=Dorcoceras hygrometricum TaxID=472368 RepID=A0A2Z7B7L4_9LAMI|nr:hypothetical protein F511_36457 [Dorcoceras hygrometricum]
MKKQKFMLLPYNSESPTPEDSQALQKVFSPAKYARSKSYKLVKPISSVPATVDEDLPPPIIEESSQREKSLEVVGDHTSQMSTSSKRLTQQLTLSPKLTRWIRGRTC